jgi:hypothetical protein
MIKVPSPAPRTVSEIQSSSVRPSVRRPAPPASCSRTDFPDRRPRLRWQFFFVVPIFELVLEHMSTSTFARPHVCDLRQKKITTNERTLGTLLSLRTEFDRARFVSPVKLNASSRPYEEDES